MVGYSPNGMEADQCFITVHWWAKMDLFVLVWRPLLAGWIWKSSSSLPMITNDDDMIGSINCPPIPRSSTLWTVTGIQNDLFIYLFIFGGCGAWGSTSHWLLYGGVAHIVATWHTSWPHVWFWLAGGFCFRWKPFQISCIFQGKTFWFLAFLFSLLHLLSVIGFSDSLSCAFCS